MDTLPNEIFLVILDKLDNYELTQARIVSHKWNNNIVKILEKYSTNIIDCVIDGNYYYLTKRYKKNDPIYKNNYYTSLVIYFNSHHLKQLFIGQILSIDHCLTISLDKGHSIVARLLFEKGANLHVYTALNDALGNAAKNGYLEIVKLLLEKGANLHTTSNYALRLSSTNGHLEVVKLLLEKGADLHANNDFSLRYASYNNHLEVVRLLLEKGANVNADEDYALRWASKFGYSKIVKLLLEHGANVNAASQNNIK